MDTQDWEKVKQIFNEAVTLSTQERPAFIQKACGSNDEIFQEVASLLGSNSSDVQFLDEPLSPELSSQGEEPVSHEQVGAYQLLHLLGHGGMGNVYLGKRVDGVYEQEVAVKILKRGMDTDDIIARFEAERQILANLQHPNIAKLIDAGTSDSGLPYFVMEYVQGQTITDFCDSKKLTSAERLTLFRKVCGAVQFAHQNLIIHRDLKPGNILVTEQGEPKLLDFGIAKILQQGAHEAEMRTQTGLRLLTPAYASPEQIRGLSMTTATDIYSLGVLLYELLTGHRPYESHKRIGVSVEEMICERTPEKPSHIIQFDRSKTLPDGQTTTLSPQFLCQMRGSNLAKLRRTLIGDLDQVLLMALRKEPHLRYTTAEQFSGDISAYLEGRPVLARKGSFSYHAGKWVRRNRLAVSAGVMILLLAVSFTSALRNQIEQARTERDTARGIADFLVKVFDVADPYSDAPAAEGPLDGRNVTAHQLLEKAAGEITKDTGLEPEVRAGLMDTMGRAFSNLGSFDEAKPLLDEALTLRQTNNSPKLKIAQTRIHLGTVHLRLENWAIAESLFKKALAGQREELGLQHSEHVDALVSLSTVYVTQNKYQEARALLEEALLCADPVSGNIKRAGILSDLAFLYNNTGEYDKALGYYQQALEIHEQGFGPNHPMVASTLGLIAIWFSDQGDLEQAVSYERRALAIYEQTLGPEHPTVATHLNNLGMILSQTGQIEEAEELLERALKIRKSVWGENHSHVATTYHNLGSLYTRLGRYTEALENIEKAIEIHRKVFGENHTKVASGYWAMGTNYVYITKFAEAQPYLRKAIALYEEILGPNDPKISTLLNSLGLTHSHLKQYDQAEPLFKKALAIAEAAYGTEHSWYADVLNTLGGMYYRKGDPEQAKPLFRKALSVHEAIYGPNHPKLVYHLDFLGLIHDDRGEHKQAEAYFRRGLAIRRKSLGNDHPHLAVSLQRMTNTLVHQNKYEDAKPFSSEAVALAARKSGNGLKEARYHSILEKHVEILLYLGEEQEAKPFQENLKALKKNGT